MKIDIFHTATVCGIEFIGWISFDGPRISSRAGGSVNLGPCSIRHFEPPRQSIGVDHYPKGWYIVKYNSEVKISLHGFSEPDAIQLSTEFGIPIRREWEGPPMGSEDFYVSHAFEGLRLWVRNHPRKAKQLARNLQYLPGCYEKAIS